MQVSHARSARQHEILDMRLPCVFHLSESDEGLSCYCVFSASLEPGCSNSVMLEMLL